MPARTRAPRAPAHLLVRVLTGVVCLAAAACGGPQHASPAATAMSTPTPGGPGVSSAPAAATTGEPTAVARRSPVVVLDPGHAVDESGAVAYGVVEKDSNLDMAKRVADVLRARGVEVILTRTADVRAAAPGEQPAQVTGYSGTRLDLQARIDIANAAHADALVSLHSNGAPDAETRGYEVYYNGQRPFSAESRTLAGLLLDGVSAEMRAAGYSAMARGIFDDACLKAFQGRCFPLFILGPPRVTGRDEVYRRGGTPEALGFAPGQETISSRASQMPGALVELLFISSPADAALLRDEGARNAMARGVARGVLEFLSQTKQGG